MKKPNTGEATAEIIYTRLEQNEVKFQSHFYAVSLFFFIFQLKIVRYCNLNINSKGQAYKAPVAVNCTKNLNGKAIDYNKHDM